MVIQTLVVLVLGIFPIGFLLVDFVAGRFDALSRDRFNRFFLALFLGLHWCLVRFLALVYGDFSREVCFWAIGFKTALDLGMALWLVARVIRGECLRGGVENHRLVSARWSWLCDFFWFCRYCGIPIRRRQRRSLLA